MGLDIRVHAGLFLFTDQTSINKCITPLEKKLTSDCGGTSTAEKNLKSIIMSIEFRQTRIS
jgi:hypothetical protein